MNTFGAAAPVRMEQLTWAEIAEAVTDGKDTVICVVGSIEQHGPHLPVETDCYYGIAMAERVARARGGTLVAPVIRPGCSQHHEGFAGTFSIPAALLVENVLAQLRSLIAAGFAHIVLTSSHGGNFNPLAASADRFEELCASNGVQLTTVLDLLGWIDALKAAPNAHGLRQDDMPAVQADLIETSIMMSLHPEMVRTERIERGFVGDFDLDASFATEGVKALSANGILGDPTAATAELGAEILDHLERYLADAIESARRSAR